MSQNSTSHTDHFPHAKLAHEQGQMSEEGELGTEYTEAVCELHCKYRYYKKTYRSRGSWATQNHHRVGAK